MFKIITVKRSIRQIAVELREAAETKAKCLGGGAFASVYAHPTDASLAVKIGFVDGRIGAKNNILKQEGYLNFIRLCQVFPSKFLPRVVSVTVYVDERNPKGAICFVAVMERLSGDKGDWSKRKDIAKHIWQDLTDVTDVGNGQKRKEILKSSNDPHTINLVKCLDALYKLPRVGWDLHGGNWMIRIDQAGNKIPVITDPAV